MGQIMHRMKLKWNGVPGSTAETAGTFKKMAIMTVAFYCLNGALAAIAGGSSDGNLEESPGLSGPYGVLDGFLKLSFFLFLVMVVTNTRKHVRHAYAIPGGDTDCCTACLCTCCVITQMARHTVDFNTQKASLCSKDGLYQDVVPLSPV